MILKKASRKTCFFLDFFAIKCYNKKDEQSSTFKKERKKNHEKVFIPCTGSNYAALHTDVYIL